jgi:hypothetical protein
MTLFLSFLLIVAITGLGFVGFYAFKLHTRVIQLDTEISTQLARYDQDSKKWNDYSTNIKTQYQALVNKYNENVKKWNEFSAALKAENQRLSKWKNVADAEVQADEMLRNAGLTLEKAHNDANNLMSTAQQQANILMTDANQKAETQLAETNKNTSSQLAKANETVSTITAEAKQQAKALRDQAQAILDSATTQVAKIIDAANKKAEEVAGSAYEALKNASLYERTVKAMKNIIEGYGDQYIIPEQSLLDDLADDFSHTQAGQELKGARERTKVMIRNGTAATCDYVEANRRETAINFVVDAFNGKIDSILSRVKHDNAGKLEQEMRDAFTLVNFNGKAFRDAGITEEYLEARLNELKWAVVTQQLKLEEREEQRYAKEQAREEARAAKEHARALREAAKEEETLRKAMEQAQEQFDQASGEQKAMYEQRLQDMAERLKQALERKERARSMAEQTKKGHVYIISNIGSFGEDVYKIGLTRRDDPFDRVHELGDSSVPFEFDVHAMILSEDAPALEQQLHRYFVLRQMNKVNHRKEFFRVSLNDIREEIEKLGLTSGVHWTMTSEAKCYRESMAIEKVIKDNPAMRESWIKRQLDLEHTVNNISEDDISEDDILEPVGTEAE